MHTKVRLKYRVLEKKLAEELKYHEYLEAHRDEQENPLHARKTTQEMRKVKRRMYAIDNRMDRLLWYMSKRWRRVDIPDKPEVA